MAQRLVLVRHARIAAAQVGRLIGSTDLPLDPLGESQARALAPRAVRWSPERCCTSPLLRCRQTATAMFPDRNLPVPRTPAVDTLGATTMVSMVPGLSSSVENTVGQANRGTHQFGSVGAPGCDATATSSDPAQFLRVDDDLREIDFGRCEGRTFDEVAREDPSLAARWAALEPDFAFPGGERLGDFFDRVRRAAVRLARDDVPTVMAVTHKGVIRAMICHFLGLEPWQYVLFDVGYAAAATIDLFDGKGVLTSLERLELPEDAHG